MVLTEEDSGEGGAQKSGFEFLQDCCPAPECRQNVFTFLGYMDN